MIGAHGNMVGPKVGASIGTDAMVNVSNGAGGVFKFPTTPRKAYRTGVVSWSVSHWSTPAPCREMGIYQPWVHPVQRLKVEPEPGRPPGPDVTYQHISGGHQGLEGGEACSRVEVELGRSLPAVIVVEDAACVGVRLNLPQLCQSDPPPRVAFDLRRWCRGWLDTVGLGQGVRDCSPHPATPRLPHSASAEGC